MSGRHRHPAAVFGVLVLALLAARAAAPLLAPPAAPAPARPAVPAGLPEPTQARLLVGGEDGLLRVDLDSGTVRAVPLPGQPEGADDGLVRQDGVVVAVRGGAAYALRGARGWPAWRLGAASYALAAAEPGRVWLVEQTGDPDRWYRVRAVTLPPATPERRVVAGGTLPLGHRPVAGVPGGLLVAVTGPEDAMAVWDAGSGRTSPPLVAGAPVTAAAHGRQLAWVDGAGRLHLADLASGRDRTVAAPAGSDGYAGPGAFSPDGRLLAAITRAGYSSRPALALVAVDQGRAWRVAGSEGALADRCSPCLAWAPAGDWVFFARLGPGFGIGAYRPDRVRAATVPLDLPGSYPPSFVTL